DLRNAVVERENKRLLAKILGGIVRERIAPRFEEVGGGNVSCAHGAGFIDVQTEPDDLLDFAKQSIKAKIGRRIEGRVAAKDEKRFNRALADPFGEIADTRRFDVGNKSRENGDALITKRLIDLRDQFVHFGRLLAAADNQ